MSSPENSQPDTRLDAPVPPPNAEPTPPVSEVVDPFAGPAPPPTLATTPPVEDPVWNGWDVLLIAALAFVSMVVLQFAVLLAAQRFAYPRLSLQDLTEKPIILLVSQVLIYIPVMAFMFLMVEGKYHVRFWRALRWNWPRSVWKMLALGVVLLFGLNLLQGLMPMPKDTPFEHLFDRPRDAYLLSLLAVSLGPLMEELFFRGFMYPVLARRLGVVWAVLLSALPFGLIHLPQYGWAWAAGLVIFLVGVVCGAVRAVTKSVGASFLVHISYNGTQMVLAAFATHGFRHMDNAMLVNFR